MTAVHLYVNSCEMLAKECQAYNVSPRCICFMANYFIDQTLFVHRDMITTQKAPRVSSGLSVITTARHSVRMCARGVCVREGAVVSRRRQLIKSAQRCLSDAFRCVFKSSVWLDWEMCDFCRLSSHRYSPLHVPLTEFLWKAPPATVNCDGRDPPSCHTG